MIWLNNPRSLQNILYSKVSQSFLIRCPSTDQQIRDFYKGIKAIRKFCAGLPSTIVEQLIKNCSQNCTPSTRDASVQEMYPRQLYFLEIFLQENIQNVNVNLLGFEIALYLNRVMELVSENSRSLRSLTIKIGTNVCNHPSGEHYQLLKQTLSSSAYLTSLTLRGICTNEILDVIGRECSKLEELDVSFSPITDIGVNLLTQNITISTNYIEENNSQWESTFWRLPDIFPPVTRLVPLREHILQATEVKYYSRSKSSLCSTIRKLNLTGSYVSYRGLLVALELFSNLEILGNEMDELLSYLLREKWNIHVNQRESLKLTKVEVKYVFHRRMGLVKILFPRMRELKFHGISFNVIRDTMPPLECLVNAGSLLPEELRRLKLYLSEKGHHLKELSLTLKILNPLDMSSTLSNCINLHSLTLESYFGRVKINYTPTMPNVLRKIRLFFPLSEDSLINLLKKVPHLEEIFIRNIEDKTKKLIKRICEVAPRQTMKIFWVSFGAFLQTKEELMLFINTFDQIKVLGELPPSLKKICGNFE